MNENMKDNSLIVFDMDGVIIDVSRSYRDTVRQTARLFFREANSWKKLPDPLFSLQDLARVKQSGGLNNDWDLTFWVITLLFTQVESPSGHNDPDTWIKYHQTISSCDVASLADFLNSEKHPVTDLFKKYGTAENEFIASLFKGDVGSGNIIKQIFQEIYLGKELFETTYEIPARIYDGEGYINRETSLVDPSVLERLSRRYTLAIATGRPRAEAEYPLELFGLKKFFPVICTLDDCLEEEQRIFEKEKRKVSLSKPNPFMLDAVSQAHNRSFSKYYYIGDMPDDMEAASRSRSKFVGIGILISASDKDHLRKDLEKAGADHIVQDFEELIKIVERC